MDKKPSCSEIDKDFERLVPRFLKLQPGSEKSKEVAERLRQFYFDGQEFTKKTYKNYIDVCLGLGFRNGVNFCLAHDGHGVLGRNASLDYLHASSEQKQSLQLRIHFRRRFRHV